VFVAAVVAVVVDGSISYDSIIMRISNIVNHSGISSSRRSISSSIINSNISSITSSSSSISSIINSIISSISSGMSRSDG